MKKNEEKDASLCIHCHICRNNCAFLNKYGLDIGDSKQLKDLAYHCFLCGKCTAVCPRGIDGRGQMLKLRQEQVKRAGGRLKEKGYTMLLKEKQEYLFKNYKHMTPKSVLFPGCNFPSFYPETTKKLIGIMENEGIGVVFDCCSKPVAELGQAETSDNYIKRMEDKLRGADVEELVMLCPNCYYFIKKRMDLKVTTIYEKLYELGLGEKIKRNIFLFLPCPDREERGWLKWIKPYVEGEINPIEGTQCCGLGGCAGKKEPELAKGMAQQLTEAGYEKIYTYCGSCSGNLKRNGYSRAHHLLTEIMLTNERPDTEKSIINRMKMKYW